MRTSTLVGKEMLKSPGSTLALLLAVMLSVATAVAVMTTTDALSDRVRVLMRDMGKNVIVLAPGSTMEHVGDHSPDRPRMSEALFRKLTGTDPKDLAVRHLVPELRGTLVDGGRKLRVIGVGAENDIGKEKPPAVERGTLVAGAEAAVRLGLTEGGEVELGGRIYKVAKIAPPSGTPDDAALTVYLADAQEMLGAASQITAITALSCMCKNPFITSAEHSVSLMLPEAKVITMRAIALARVETRRAVGRFGLALSLAAGGLGAIAVLMALWGNVSRRMGELGTYIAMGASPTTLAALLWWKVAFIALFGAAAGWALGSAAAVRLGAEFSVKVAGFDTGLLPMAAGIALAVALVGAAAPLIRALTIDAASVLREG